MYKNVKIYRSWQGKIHNTGIQLKITWYAKRQENTTQYKENNQLIKTKLKLTGILELAKKEL